MKSYIYLSSIGYLLGDCLSYTFEGSSKKQIRRENIESLNELKAHINRPYIYSNNYGIFLASLDSLLNGFNSDDILDKYYELIRNGKYLSYRNYKEINPAIRRSVERYKDEGIDSSMAGGIKSSDNGNGILVRGLAFSLYLYKDKNELSKEDFYRKIDDFSSVTHQHFKSKISLGIFVNIVFSFIDNYRYKKGKAIREILKEAIDRAYDHYKSIGYIKDTLKSFNRIFSLALFDLDKDKLLGGAFVIDTLELIIYSLVNSKTLEDSILLALSFGKDTSINVGLTCGLSSMYYGLNEEDEEYVESIEQIGEIKKIIGEFGGKYES